MKHKDIKKGNWYFIDYADEEKFLCDGSFTGEARLVKVFKTQEIEDTEYYFESPLAPDETMFFHLDSIKRECEPLPSYQELLQKYKEESQS